LVVSQPAVRAAASAKAEAQLLEGGAFVALTRVTVFSETRRIRLTKVSLNHGRRYIILRRNVLDLRINTLYRVLLFVRLSGRVCQRAGLPKGSPHLWQVRNFLALGRAGIVCRRRALLQLKLKRNCWKVEHLWR